PDASQAIRAQTTVPQQALYLMNAAFVIDQARALAQQTADLKPAARRVAELYRRTLARHPDPEELAMAEAFLDPQARQSDGSDELQQLPACRIGYGAFDVANERVTFTPLPHFSCDAWQGSEVHSDPQLKYTGLTAHGGHPGSTAEQSVI